MDARRAQDLLKHITQDEDYGLKAMREGITCRMYING